MRGREKYAGDLREKDNCLIWYTGLRDAVRVKRCTTCKQVTAWPALENDTCNGDSYDGKWHKN
jgi:hypothetical protein